jgi:iron(III) transport system ATP-binding protein
MTPIMALEQVGFRYGSQDVLDHFELSIAPGEAVVLLGPSGSGKSTVLRLLLGFAAPESGAIRLAGDLVSTAGRVLVPPEERNLAVVFQDLALWPHLSVRGNVEFGLASRGMPGAERDRRIRDVLSSLGLAGKENRFPRELSGGERQRTAIARALALEPRAVLLDEPFANLDALLKRQLIDSFRTLFEQRNLTVLHVTHDVREAAALGDRIAILENGRVVQEGSVADLRARPSTEFVRALIADLDGGLAR